MKTKKCGQNSLKLTSMMTQKRKHLKCASYIKKQKEFLRENYHYNLGKKRFPKTNFEKYETNRLIFCKMNPLSIPEQIKEAKEERNKIESWKRENKEELRYWTQELKEARKSGIEDDIKNAEKQVTRLSNLLKSLETERVKTMQRLEALENTIELTPEETCRLLEEGAIAHERCLLEAVTQDFRKKHNHQKKYDGLKCRSDIGEGWATSQILRHMARDDCDCARTFKFLFEDKEYSMPANMKKRIMDCWGEMSQKMHSSLMVGSDRRVILSSSLSRKITSVMIKLVKSLNYEPFLLNRETATIRKPHPEEEHSSDDDWTTDDKESDGEI
eukprot:TRINITY_DN861_c0_g1_i11.p1 TRINITY_DN861_c0_g1~~TRINITY_DN861_c0_g1_i11.p1  ORF type:complete len:329 (-),score=72.82 TRINITY_DN861_c0_g1_i11:107-1093(-)